MSIYVLTLIVYNAFNQRSKIGRINIKYYCSSLSGWTREVVHNSHEPTQKNATLLAKKSKAKKTQEQKKRNLD